jgi:hypothetical protein
MYLQRNATQILNTAHCLGLRKLCFSPTEWIMSKISVTTRGTSGWRLGEAGSSCEHGNEPSGDNKY